MDTPNKAEFYTPITEFSKEPHAARLIGRMMVIVYDRQQPDYVVQGIIKRIWVNPNEPRVLRVKLTQVMHYLPDPFDASIGVWRYEDDTSRTLHLKDQGPRATSVIHDPVTDEIILALMDQGFKLKITSPDTNHPSSDEILPATGAIPLDAPQTE